MRLFIAALLPDNIRDQLTTYINSLSEGVDGVKWEKSEKLHLTLKFLGDVEGSRAEKISSLLGSLVDNCSPFKLNIEEFGAFPRLKNPRVLYIGLSQNLELSKFHSELDKEFSELGFEKEDRKFMPHITIGRVKKRISLKEAPNISQTPFELNKIGLIESELRREGSVYTPLRLFNLEK